jgi:hypothetical protein
VNKPSENITPFPDDPNNMLGSPLYIEDIRCQIEKDFGIAGFTFSGDDYTELASLLPELLNEVTKLRTTRNSDWMKVVFRVDLTEKQYQFVKKMGGDTHENMAKAVLLREFQKVHTRKQYSRT